MGNSSLFLGGGKTLEHRSRLGERMSGIVAPDVGWFVSSIAWDITDDPLVASTGYWEMPRVHLSITGVGWDL